MGSCDCDSCDMCGGVTQFLTTHVSYSSVRVAKIHNWRLGLLYGITQVTVIGLVLIYGLVINRAYQRSEAPAGVVTISASGSGGAYDSLDVVPSPLEYNAHFIATKMMMTSQTSNSVCDDDSMTCTPNQANALACTAPPGSPPLIGGSGLAVLTGNCSSAGYCIARGWCPLEATNMPSPTTSEVRFPEVSDFQYAITLSAYFPSFSAPLRYSLWADSAGNYRSPTLREILLEPGWTYADPAATLSTGGLALMYVDLGDCDLDQGLNCSSTTSVTFEQVATRFKYRTASYHPPPPINMSAPAPVSVSTQRVMYTYSGIRLVAVLGGRAGKFDFAALLTAIGAGFGMLSIATILTDSFIKWCATNRSTYRQSIVLDVFDSKHPPSTEPSTTQLLATQH